MFTPQFRKPSLYFKLPSEGKNYPENSLELLPNGEIPIYTATALDDIATKTVDGLFNGVATVEVIKSCVWVVPISEHYICLRSDYVTCGHGIKYGHAFFNR